MPIDMEDMNNQAAKTTRNKEENLKKEMSLICTIFFVSQRFGLICSEEHPFYSKADAIMSSHSWKLHVASQSLHFDHKNWMEFHGDSLLFHSTYSSILIPC